VTVKSEEDQPSNFGDEKEVVQSLTKLAEENELLHRLVRIPVNALLGSTVGSDDVGDRESVLDFLICSASKEGVSSDSGSNRS
jgi:hypothetical protein